MNPRSHPFIDDRAVDASMSDDEQDDDPDSAEAQIRAADQRDFPMAALDQGHEARLRQAAPYHMPQDLFSSGAGTPSVASAKSSSWSPSPVAGPSTAVTQSLRASTPASSSFSGFTPNSTPSAESAPAYARQTPAPDGMPAPLFLPGSRGPTPYTGPDRHPLFLPESRGPTPYTGPQRDLTPWAAPQYHPDRPLGTANPAGDIAPRHSGVPFPVAKPTRAASPPSASAGPSKKRRRLDQSADEEEEEEEQEEEEEKHPLPDSDSDLDEEELENSDQAVRERLKHFFDLTASDSDEDDEDDPDDAEGESDKEFIDDDEHEEVAPVLLGPPTDDTDQLRSLAAKFEETAPSYEAELEAERAADRVPEQTEEDRKMLEEEWNERKKNFELFKNRRLNNFRYPETMGDFTHRKVIPTIPRPTSFLHPPAPINSEVEPGDWVRHKKHGLAYAVSSRELLVPIKVPWTPDDDELLHPSGLGHKHPRHKTTGVLNLTVPLPRKRKRFPPLRPTIDDLIPFQPLLGVRRFLDNPQYQYGSTTMVPGDRVIVQKGDKKYTGTILMLRESRKGKEPDPEENVLVLKLLSTPKFDTLVAASAAALEPDAVFKMQGPIVDNLKLLRHPLDASPQLCIGDRVRARFNGFVGRIVGFGGDHGRTEGNMWDTQDIPVVSLLRTINGKEDRANFYMSDLGRIFRVGDEVIVVRGEHKHREGLVVEVLLQNAFLEVVLDSADRREIPVPVRVKSKDVNFFFSAMHDAINRGTFNVVAPEVEFELEPEFDSDFESDFKDASPRRRHRAMVNERGRRMITHHSTLLKEIGGEGKPEFETWQLIKNLVLNALEEDQRTDDRIDVILKLMNTGKRFEHREVQVFAGQYKGWKGVVKADYDSAARRAREMSQLDLIAKARKLQKAKEQPLPTMHGIILTVRREASNAEFNVEIEKCLDSQTLLPLCTAMVLSEARLAERRHLLLEREDIENILPQPTMWPSVWPPPERPRTPEVVAVAVEAAPIPEVPAWDAVDTIFGPPPTLAQPRRLADKLKGENDGSWMCLPGLAGKRLDVRVDGTGTLQTHYFKPSAKARAADGKCGVVIDAPLQHATLEKKSVTVYGLGGNKLAIPPLCIKPARHRGETKDVSLTQFEERVVIIGADVRGSVVALCQYGRTCPGAAHSFGHDCVQVKFERSSGLEAEVFHISSLCRSTNLDFRGPITILATRFD